MRIISLPTKSHNAGLVIFAALTLGGFTSVADAQQVANKPVTDVMEVMREHSAIAEINLWPIHHGSY